MKITICGSIAFIDKMIEQKVALEKMGYEVFIPSFEAKDSKGNPISPEEFYRIRKSGNMDLQWFETEKSRAIQEHFTLIKSSDVVLIANYEKNGTSGYIGGNTLMEMGVAFYLNKKIYLLNGIPEISYKEEIVGMKPFVINGDITKIQ